MNTDLKLLFSQTRPEDSESLQSALLIPDQLSILLNASSTLVDGPQYYGKSTLAFLAQNARRDEWLNVPLELVDDSESDVSEILLHQITRKVWRHIVNSPGSLASLGYRAVTVRYFLDRFMETDTVYVLKCLSDKYPEVAEAIDKFLSMEVREIFDDNATFNQKLTVLCEAIVKLGMEAVVIWADISESVQHFAPANLQMLSQIFDSLYLMINKRLFIKCLAQPSICDYLAKSRGINRFKVDRIALRWRKDQLLEMVDRRLQAIGHLGIRSLAQIVNVDDFISFLTEFSDPNSPFEWLTLTRLILEKHSPTTELPITSDAWLTARRDYCRKRVPLHMDEQGNFWRGVQLLRELTPRKRAIYPFVQYLYEHPGVHLPYRLMDKFDIDETNLNTMISRIRQIIEPFPLVAGESNEQWIYLVTDPRGNGYELRTIQEV